MLSEKDLGKLHLIIDYCNYINKIIQNVDGDIEVFKNDFISQHAISFDILQTGESINILSQDTKDKYKEIYWHKIIGMRNIIVHKYGAIDYQILFDSAKNNVPELKKNIAKK